MAEKLSERREIKEDEEKDISIVVDEGAIETEDSSEQKIEPSKQNEEKPIKVTEPINEIKVNKINLKFEPVKTKNKSINKYKPFTKKVELKKNNNKSIGKNNIIVKKVQSTINIAKESSSPNDGIIIKLNPLKKRDKDKVMDTNGFLNQISYFHKENEVLFFPFSSFELVDIYEKKVDIVRTFIELDYSTRFLKKLDNCIFIK